MNTTDNNLILQNNILLNINKESNINEELNINKKNDINEELNNTYIDLNNINEININNIIFNIDKNIKSITIINFENNIKKNEYHNKQITENNIQIFFLYEYIWHTSFGHWFYECAIFLPYFCIIKKKYKNIKLLVNKYPIRNYKKLLFDLFDINDNDIYYLEDNNYDYHNNTYYNNIPLNNICIISNNNTLNTKIHLINNNFVDILNYFYNEINNKIELNNISYKKTIKNLYLPKNKVQNYEPNQYAFDYNRIYNVLKDIEYTEYDTINTINFIDQIKLLATSENIYLQYGSSLIVNGLFCKNSTIYINVLQDINNNMMYSIIHNNYILINNKIIGI
jgi:hypothetical protein